MEKYFIALAGFIWLIIITVYLCRVAMHQEKIAIRAYKILVEQNIDALDLAKFIELLLLEKAKHTALTAEEKNFFDKAHEAIPRIEGNLKILR